MYWPEEGWLRRWDGNKDNKGKLDDDQYGNTKGSSTTHYLIKLTDLTYRSTDEGLVTTAITID